MSHCELTQWDIRVFIFLVENGIVHQIQEKPWLDFAS